MTPAREAAIANGWNPDDGSPWVGPDGVTYPSKEAFYASQTVAHGVTTCVLGGCGRYGSSGDTTDSPCPHRRPPAAPH